MEQKLLKKWHYMHIAIGLEYIAITDHTKSLKISNGLDEEKILNQIYRINELNDKLKSELPLKF